MKRVGLTVVCALSLMLVGCKTNNKEKATDEQTMVGEKVEKDEEKSYPDSISPCLKIVDYLDRPLGSVRAMVTEMLNGDGVYDSHKLYGYWFTPHAACVINIIFKTDNTFIMRDGTAEEVDSLPGLATERTGEFRLKGDSIYLSCEDGWKLALRYWKGGDDDNKYITLGDDKKGWKHYMQKGSD